jgi:hypothetical protein
MKAAIKAGNRSGDLPAGPKVDPLRPSAGVEYRDPHHPSARFARFARAL